MVIYRKIFGARVTVGYLYKNVSIESINMNKTFSFTC